MTHFLWLQEMICIDSQRGRGVMFNCIRIIVYWRLRWALRCGVSGVKPVHPTVLSNSFNALIVWYVCRNLHLLTFPNTDPQIVWGWSRIFCLHVYWMNAPLASPSHTILLHTSRFFQHQPIRLGCEHDRYTSWWPLGYLRQPSIGICGCGVGVGSGVAHQSIDPPPSSWETQTKPYANPYNIGLLLTLLLLTIFIIRCLISFASNTWISSPTKTIWGGTITQMSVGRWCNRARPSFFGSFQSQMWFSVCDLCCHQHLQSVSRSLSLSSHSVLGPCLWLVVFSSEPRQPWSPARDRGYGAGKAAESYPARRSLWSGSRHGITE